MLDLGRELTAASKSDADLSGRLVEAVKTRKSPDVSPPGTRAEENDACRRDFRPMSHWARQQAEGRDVPIRAPSGSTTSRRSPRCSTTRSDRPCAGSSPRRSDAGRWRSSIGSGRSHLWEIGSSRRSAQCHEKAGALHAALLAGAWTSLSDEAVRLAEGDHPFAHLLTLIEQRDTLSDADWARLHASVGAALGVPLAQAASRARLVVTTPTVAPVASDDRAPLPEIRPLAESPAPRGDEPLLPTIQAGSEPRGPRGEEVAAPGGRSSDPPPPDSPADPPKTPPRRVLDPHVATDLARGAADLPTGVEPRPPTVRVAIRPHVVTHHFGTSPVAGPGVLRQAFRPATPDDMNF